MQVHFKKPIKEKLDEAIREAKVQGKQIDWIELSREEWADLEKWLDSGGVFWRTTTINSPAHYNGVEIRKKVEPEVEPEVEDEVVLRFVVEDERVNWCCGYTDFTAYAYRYGGAEAAKITTIEGLGVQSGDELEVRVKRRGK